jgi:hypothetical protein
MLEDPDHRDSDRDGGELLPVESRRYFVPVAVKIPGSELALARRRGATHTLIDFIGEIKDDKRLHAAERPRQARSQALR